MELINSQIPNLNNIFKDDIVSNSKIVKIDNPGGGECLYTSIVNFIRVEFLVKKHLYKMGLGAIDKSKSNLYLPYMLGSNTKINDGGLTLKEEGRYLRDMVCKWLKVHGDDIYAGTEKKIKEFILDPDEDDDFIDNFLSRDDKVLLSIDKKYKKYLEYMSKPSSYGGVCEIYSIGKLLRRNIRLYNQTDTGEYRSTGVGFYSDEYKEIPTIGIYHTVLKNHYKTLYPKKTGNIEIGGMIKG